MFSAQGESGLGRSGRVEMSIIPEATQATLALTIIDIIDEEIQ